MDAIQCAVVGLGFFGEKHAEVLSDLPGVRLEALCTRRTGRLRELAERFRVEKSFTDYRELLKDRDIQVVDVVTPYTEHSRIVVDALQADQDVFVEKPMASTVAECGDMVAAAKAAVDEGRLGQVRVRRRRCRRCGIDMGPAGQHAYQIEARFDIIGIDGALTIDCGETGTTVNDSQDIHKPDTAYWPLVHGTSSDTSPIVFGGAKSPT